MEWPFLQELESGELFSKVCREMILPQGVLYWMKRARQSAEINATVGVMRDERVDGPPGICYLKAVHAALAELDPEVVYPYAPVTGIEGLRKVWRDWLIRKGGAYLEGRSDLVCQPIVTQGLTNALFVAGRLFIDPDDVVVVPRKRWENYDLVFSGHLGARLGEFTATDRDGWCMESFAIALETFNPEQRIRIVVVNLPFNPTGYMPTREEAFRMRDILVAAADSRRSPLVVVLDDAYEGFVMSEEALPCSLFNLLVDAHPNLIPIKVDGISKEFLWWGGRVAFLTMGLHSQHLSSAAVSPTTVAKRRDELSALFEYKAGAVIRSTISNTNRPVQEALLRVMQSRERLDGALAERAAFIEILARRINLFKQLLSTLDSRLIQPDPFNAGFFLFLNLAPELSAQEFARIMLDSYKVGVVPFEDSARGINGLRITFASIPSAHIERVVQAIAMTLKNLEIQHKTNK